MVVRISVRWHALIVVVAVVVRGCSTMSTGTRTWFQLFGSVKVPRVILQTQRQRQRAPRHF